MRISAGIVLRNYKNDYYKVSLLDKEHGHITGIVSHNNVSQGSLITYMLEQKGQLFFVSDIQFIAIPFGLAQQDLLFLHHILEVVYYFAPIGSGFTQIFDLLAFLYTIEHMVISNRFKKFFMVRLLTCLAVVPEMGKKVSDTVRAVSHVEIAEFQDDILDDDKEKQLDMWLLHCIGHHPRVDSFKTVHFLEKYRVK